MNAQVTKEIFESFKLQERRDVSCDFPEDYSKEKKYPFIIVLDADYLFDNVVAAVKFYGIPQAIIARVHQSKDNLQQQDGAFDEITGLPGDITNFF